MSGEIRVINSALDMYGVGFVLQTIYDECGKRTGDRFVSKEQFWEHIAVIRQKEGQTYPWM